MCDTIVGMICNVENCTDTSRHTNGMCYSHYYRWTTYGNTDESHRTRSNATWEDRLYDGRWERRSGPLETECWIWTGQLDQTGYGVLKYHQKAYKAHRAMWALRNGPIPEGKYACHKCDTPACINPEHIFIGTQGDNMKDAKRKGRTRANRGRSDDEIRMAKAMVRGGMPRSKVAKHFGIDTGSMTRIMQGVLYANVE